MSLGQLVQERGVDVIADAEGEDARVGRVLGHRVLHDLVHVGLADGRLAVGEEHHVEAPAFVAGAIFQGRGQGVVDGGAAGGFEAFDPFLGMLEVSRSLTSWSLSRYLLTVVAKLIRAKRSLVPRFLRQYLSALRAWSILGPRMLPDVSSTSTMSRGTWYSLAMLNFGLISKLK